MILTVYYLVVGGSILLACLLCAIIVRSQNSSTDCPSDSFLLQSRSSLEGEPWWERAAVARRMSIDVNKCRVCQKQTTTQCSLCKSVKYCSQVCQRNDWGSCHKFECANLKNLRNNAAKAAAAGNSKPPFLDPNEDAPVPQQVLFPYELFLQLRKNPSSCRRAPIGLINHGNNCYANAALQCLLYTKPLRAYLDQGLHSKDCNRPHDRDWCLLCVLSRLCHEMSHAPMHAEMSLKPLLRHLRRFAKTMSYGRQEDAHEFFYSVLNTMEAIQLANLGGKERFDMRSQETTLVHHVFGGYLRSQVVCCGCGAASRRYEAALDLQLEVPAGVDRLEDVLQRHTADEVLDGDNCYACDGCKQRCRATRSTRFEVAPNTLVLCLKRFGTGRFGKINKVLVYGEKLDLGPFMAAGAMDDGPATYTLTGVVVHLDQMNSTSFGHYVSFVRSWDGNGSSGQWYACDDSRVCRTRASDVLSQNAYMLFYQRDTPKLAPQPGYVRPAPLLPLTAAQQAAVAAAAAAAAAPTTPKAQEAVKVANGVAAAALAAGPVAVPDTQQLDQQQQRAAAEAAGAVVHEQQQQQQPLLAAMRSQPPPAQPDSGELLPRIATAPAALALLAGRVGSSSRDEDDSGSHATTSSSACLADLSACSTPSYHGNSTAAAADGWGTDGHGYGSNGSNADSSTSGRPPGRQSTEQQGAAGAAAGGGKVPPHTLRRRRQQQQRQAQAGAAAAGEQAAPGTAGEAAPAEVGGGSSDHGSLPSIRHRVVVAGPELLQVRLELPGVTTAAEVQVSLEPPSEQQQQQCLWLQVPGRFAELQLPLGPHLQSGQGVGAVSGRFYRKQQQLKLKLRLAAAAEGAAAVGAEGDGSSTGGANGSSSAASGQHSSSSSSMARQSLDFHLTDSFDTSSGSESEGYHQQQRQAGSSQGRAGGMHAVASERDLCSIFGRHSATVAHQLMQQLQKQRGAGQDGAGAGEAGAAGAASGKKSGGAKKKAQGKKKGKKK